MEPGGQGARLRVRLRCRLWSPPRGTFLMSSRLRVYCEISSLSRCLHLRCTPAFRKTHACKKLNLTQQTREQTQIKRHMPYTVAWEAAIRKERTERRVDPNPAPHFILGMQQSVCVLHSQTCCILINKSFFLQIYIYFFLRQTMILARD